MKKWWILLLTVIMVLCTACAVLSGCSNNGGGSTPKLPSLSDADIEYDNAPQSFRFGITEDRSSYVINKYEGSSNFVEIPAEYNGSQGVLPVTVIASYAFEDCTAQLIKIPNSIITIEDWAFRNCKKLVELEIPNSVTTFGNCLNGCERLTKLTVPFVGKSANDAEHGFIGFNFAAPSWENNANYMPSTLEEINVTGGSILFEGALAYVETVKRLSLPDTLTRIDEHALWYMGGLTDLIIPNNVSRIANGCLNGCKNLINLTIPFVGETLYSTSSSSSHIGHAFAADSGLKNVNYMPDTLRKVVLTKQERLMENAFYGVWYLTDIVLPSSLTEVATSAFLGCDNLKTFASDGVKYLSTPQNKTLLAFKAEKGIETANVAQGCIAIMDNAFSANLSLKSVTIPNSVKSIGAMAFYRNTALENVTIPNSVTSLGKGAFFGATSLKTVNLDAESNLGTVGDNAFYNCSSLQKIVLPRSISTFGRDAFYGCSSLKTVDILDCYRYFCAKFISTYSTPFAGCENLLVGGTAVNNLTVANGIIEIPQFALSNLTCVEKIIMPESVKTVNAWAFYGMTNAQTVTFASAESDVKLKQDYNVFSNAKIEFLA